MIFINNSDLLDAEWRFLEPHCDDAGISWEFHHGVPHTRLERAIRRPNLARYRAALTAARSAARTPGAVLVSHLPRMSAATNLVRRMLCPRVPQIAFAFNFTDLPEGRDRSLLSRALRHIHEFVVFSTYERTLYADHLGLPPERIRYLPWAMETPVPGPENPAGAAGYLCSIGGEGRDYALLAETMRALPHVRMVIVARPYSVAGIDFPENVAVLTNRPEAETWRIMADSAGLVIPLRSDRTTCGHITIVGAQLLGIPLVVTQSVGIADYVSGGESAHLVPAGDREALSSALAGLLDDPAEACSMATRARAIAGRRSALDGWVGYFRELRDRLEGDGNSFAEQAPPPDTQDEAGQDEATP